VIIAPAPAAPASAANAPATPQPEPRWPRDPVSQNRALLVRGALDDLGTPEALGRSPLAKLPGIAHSDAGTAAGDLRAALVGVMRLRPGRWTTVAAFALGAVILLNESFYYVWIGVRGQFDISWALPVQLCDVASVATALALWFRRQLLVELTYFWGIAGTANGLLTPDISDHWPSFGYIQYFIQHGGIPCAALFLVIGLRMTPTMWAVARVYALTVVLLVVD